MIYIINYYHNGACACMLYHSSKTLSTSGAKRPRVDLRPQEGAIQFFFITVGYGPISTITSGDIWNIPGLQYGGICDLQLPFP